MAKNTSILLGDYFEKFINEQIGSGRFSSASEVIRTALRFWEQHESKTKTLVKQLKEGEKSGMVSGFDRKNAIAALHSKYTKDEV